MPRRAAVPLLLLLLSAAVARGFRAPAPPPSSKSTSAPRAPPPPPPIAAPSPVPAVPASRRDVLRIASSFVAAASFAPRPSRAYKIEKVEPDEYSIYALAQAGRGARPLRILWVGAGDLQSSLTPRGFRRGAYFAPGNSVVALDLVSPSDADLAAAEGRAKEGGFELRFVKGDATSMDMFDDGTFDVAVSSMFLCQDFDPEVVVREVRRVLKVGGRFGFYEHVEDIDKVVIGKVFGERSVVRVQHYPEMLNIMAGVVKKV